MSGFLNGMTAMENFAFPHDRKSPLLEVKVGGISVCVLQRLGVFRSYNGVCPHCVLYLKKGNK